MTACGSLQHIFDKQLPSYILDSWKPIQTMKSIDQPPSFSDIFGELHFNENVDTTASSPINLSPSTSRIQNLKYNDNKSESGYFTTKQTGHNCHSNSFSSITSDSLSTCTEGLGFESSDEVEDYVEDNWKQEDDKSFSNPLCTLKRSRTYGSNPRFPPPISSIGSSGKPWMCFKSYRHNGRFILKEVRVPTQEFLHACREDGRLKLQFIQSDDEIAEDDEEEHDDDDDDHEYENGGRCNSDSEYDNNRDSDKNEDKDEKENVVVVSQKLK